MEKITPRNLDLDESTEIVNRFLDAAEKEVIRREAVNKNIHTNKQSLDSILRCIVESSGEVSKAMNKNRYEVIKAECIDLVYCAILLYAKANKLIVNN